MSVPRSRSVLHKSRITARAFADAGFRRGDIVDSDSWRKPRLVVAIDPVQIVLRELPPDVERRYVKSVPADTHRVKSP